MKRFVRHKNGPMLYLCMLMGAVVTWMVVWCMMFWNRKIPRQLGS